MSTYRDSDRATDLILDFISQGESAGNYNAVIGNAHASDDLSRKSLTEIYALMAERLDAGMPSTAIGRYQFIRNTLRNLQTAKGLPDHTRFTPALQDELAVVLMVWRGYSKWWRANMADADFAHGLSCEWASLPDPLNGGKSHYDGDSAGNHASTSLTAVYAMLRQARSLQMGTDVNPAIADALPVPLSWWGRLARLFG